MDTTSTRAARQPQSGAKYAAVTLLCASAPPLLALPDYKVWGWLLLACSLGLLIPYGRSRFGKHMALLIASIALLGIVPINTEISYQHMLTMGGVLILTVALPYMACRSWIKDRSISFPFRLGRTWQRREIVYVVFAGMVSYLLLPFYLSDTGSYLNWSAPLDPSHIIRLFIGTNALGIWDEIFFVGVCLALLRQHIAFVWANVAQAALWTTFLYELGFRGWGSIIIFFFALSQGYIFKRTKSMLYIITVHLTIDFMLFLVLVHLHNPGQLRIFLTSPF